MKTFVHLGSLIIAFGIAGMLAGCTSNRSTRTTQRPANDFEVMETSSKRLLTPEEMAQLRVAVAKYLEKEGAVGSGDYYVKVFLAPDKDGVSADWVVVRFTRDTEMRFSLLGSYPAYSNSYRSYGSYDYYPYGYNSFGRISFQYYDDPFYGSHYYFPRRNNHDRHHDHDRNKHPGGQHPRPPAENPVTPGEPPRVTRTRWDSNSPERNDQPRENNYPHRTGAPGRQRPSEPRRESATVAPARSEPSQTETLRNYQPRENNYPHRTGTPGRQPERDSESRRESATVAPARSSSSSYSPPATRSEPSQSSSSHYSPPARSEPSDSSDSRANQSQREANQAAAQRERLE